jgi:hypothetical protein
MRSRYRQGEDISGESTAVFGGAHDGLRTFHPQAALAKCFRRARVLCIANQEIKKILVSFGDTRD